MIEINGRQPDAGVIESLSPQGGIARVILDAMTASENTYRYDSEDQLRFELALREATVNAAKALDRSGMDFAVFRKSRCNEAFWNRTGEGGFRLKKGVRPSDAIRDIYENGQLYATECATAIMIVYYKALLDVLSPDLFDRTFPDIELMNWHHVDPLLRSIGAMRRVSDDLPGDRRYFMNPDVNPVTPEWQGENVIMLGNDRYYGHGIGIADEDTIVGELNKNRVRGAEESAYLMKQAGRPDFQRFYNILHAHGT